MGKRYGTEEREMSEQKKVDKRWWKYEKRRKDLSREL